MEEHDLIMESDYANAEQPAFIDLSILSRTGQGPQIESVEESMFGTHLKEAMSVLKEWFASA